MPTLAPLATAEAPSASQATLQSLEAKLGGTVPNMYRTFAHAPRILDATVAMAQATRRDLAPTLRELAYLKVIQLTDCHVCRHYHETHGRSAGLCDEQIHSLEGFERNNAYSTLEKDVLRFAEQWTVVGRVDASTLDRLTRNLTTEQLVVLAATVSQANLTCRFNNVFGVELP